MLQNSIFKNSENNTFYVMPISQLYENKNIYQLLLSLVSETDVAIPVCPVTGRQGLKFCSPQTPWL